jgi:hypothetical protein
VFPPVPRTRDNGDVAAEQEQIVHVRLLGPFGVTAEAAPLGRGRGQAPGGYASSCWWLPAGE